jgi:AcrR family transcriptional regulator
MGRTRTSSIRRGSAVANTNTRRAPRSDAVRTRAALLSAARRVFERNGYVSAKIGDIASEAGVAHGSFYSHFEGKDEILAAVLDQVSEEMLHPGPALPLTGDDLDSAVEAANRAYLEAYRANARLMALLEQVATVDERFRRLRLRRTEAFVSRNAAFIARLQREDKADGTLDPWLTSLALSAMVSRSAYFAFSIGKRVDFEGLVQTLTRLWVGSLRPLGS